MSTFELVLDARRVEYEPGEVMAGAVSWQLPEPPESVELRLFWYTEGRGDQDVGIVESINVDAPGQTDRRGFSFTLPLGPPSFSGSLISIIWALELIAEPGHHVERWNLVIGPNRREARVSEVPKEEKPSRKS